LHVWPYPRPGYIFQVSSKSVQGFRRARGQNVAFHITLTSLFYNSLYYRTSRDDSIRIWLLKEEGFKSAPETWKCRRRNNFGQLIPDPVSLWKRHPQNRKYIAYRIADRRTEPRPGVTCTENLVKLGRVWFLRYASGQDRQTNTHTCRHTLNTTLHSSHHYRGRTTSLIGLPNSVDNAITMHTA